jgi:hypothetical protein
MDNCVFDVILDFNGDENAARIALMKRGFTYAIHFSKDRLLSIEKRKNYLEKNNVPYAELKNSETANLFVENLEKISLWQKRVNCVNSAVNALNDTNVLIRGSSPTHCMHKNNMQKLKVKSLKFSLDIDCSNYTSNWYFPVSSKVKVSGTKISKFIKSVLESYRRSGITIDSTKDFKKLIGVSEYADYLTIKFMDEAQAAEFIVFHGDML